MKLLARLLFFLSFVTTQTSAQDSTLIISQPIGISNEGINRVLQLSNGNTALLHFENKRHMRVKLFDKTGKEIASTVPELRVVDMAMIEKTELKNLFESDGDITLFLSQAINNADALVRVILDGKTGKLKKETVVVESADMYDNIDTRVFGITGDSCYSVVSYNNYKPKDSLYISVSKYDEKHNLKETLNYAHKKIEDRYYAMYSMCSDDGDILIALNNSSKNDKLNNVVEIQFMYLRNDMHHFTGRTFTLPENVGFYNMWFTKNTFAGNLNVVLLNGEGYTISVGAGATRFSKQEQHWLIMSEDMSSVKSTVFSAVHSNDTTPDLYSSFLLAGLHTNDMGLTTVVHEDNDPKFKYNGMYWDLCRQILVSKYNDDGNQIGKAVQIPCFHKYTIGGTPNILYKTIDIKSLYTYRILITSKSVFVIMNDIPANQDVKEQSAVTEVTDFNNSEAVICQVNKKNIYTRKYFFNTVDSGEHKQVLPATLNYDEKTKVVAAVMRKKKGKQETFHMAWRRLED